ncbi:MAG: hypothetical protein RL226_1605 [Bacteroidota bacterium]|jgi:hypothetical protein
MKSSLLLFAAVIALFVFPSSGVKEASGNSFDWLVGEWKRTNDENGYQTYERWTRLEDGNYLGHGDVYAEGEVVFQEELRLRLSNNEWTLTVSSVGQDPVVFRMSSSTDSSFVVENPSHDFPKIIRYARVVDELHASIEGGTVLIDFFFAPLGG